MRSSIDAPAEYRTLLAGPGVQMILCSYCMLQWWDHANLIAPYWRWYWNDAPGAFVRTADGETELRPDRVVLIPPGTAFATTRRRPVGHLHLHFVTGARPAPQRCRPIVRTPAAHERSLIRRLRDALTGDPHASDWGVHLLAHALTALAMADLPREQWASAAIDPDVARVLAVMHERPATPLDAAALRRIAAVSDNTLLRRFRETTGTTPHRYLTRLRVDTAAVELRTTADSIDAIARRNGFCDRFHLSRAFKAVLGTGPAAYRRTQANPAMVI